MSTAKPLENTRRRKIYAILLAVAVLCAVMALASVDASGSAAPVDGTAAASSSGGSISPTPADGSEPAPHLPWNARTLRVAGDGAKALEMLDKDDADIVLMDIQMPVMDGLTATRCIRADGRAGVRDLPILAMTAHGLPEDREKCFEAGMNDHISKPVDVGELYAKLVRWLDGAERRTGNGA